MRGEERQQRSMLMVMNVEQRIPREHPLRRVKQLAEAVLRELSPTFDQMYGRTGRLSIPPERLLKASLLISPYVDTLMRGYALTTHGAAIPVSLIEVPIRPHRLALFHSETRPK